MGKLSFWFLLAAIGWAEHWRLTGPAPESRSSSIPPIPCWAHGTGRKAMVDALDTAAGIRGPHR